MGPSSPPSGGPSPSDKGIDQPKGSAVIKPEESPIQSSHSDRQDVEMEDSKDFIHQDVHGFVSTTGPQPSMNHAVSGSNSARTSNLPSNSPHTAMETMDATAPTDCIYVKQENTEDPGDSEMKHQILKHEPTSDDFQNHVVLEVDSEGEDDLEDDTEDKDDSEFDAEELSESDDSDDSDAKEKRHKAKLRAAASKKAPNTVKSLTVELAPYLWKEATGEKLTTEEHEKMEQLKTQLKVQLKAEAEKTASKAQKGPRERRAKTAREYWQRELQRDEKKRKNDEATADPKKTRKTAAQPRPGSNSESPKSSQRTDFSASKKNAASIHDASVSPMNNIKATTHAAQFQQIRAGIPEEFDTRRTKTQEKDVLSAPKSFGYKMISAIDGKWKHKFMSTPLLNYQIVATSWMIMREAKGLYPSGGLLADDMGLGKTITCIATIIGHPPEKQDKEDFCKATLVIADSPQAAKQWASQIGDHGSEDISDWTEIYSKARERKRDWWERRMVVIATYHDLLAQAPSKKKYRELKDKWAGDDASFRQDLYRKLGPLFRIKWYRVILDEAHAIKSYQSSTTLACWDLKAKYRWVVSGTPLSNSVEEFYPYLRFLGCQFAYDRRIFRSRYVKAEDAAQNFEALVSMIMYRRKQNDKFLGYDLITLPKSHSHDLWVPLSSWEMILNKVVDNRYQTELLDEQKSDQSDDSDDGQHNNDENGELLEDEDDVIMDENKATIVDARTAFKIQTTRCTRLRQLSSHPFNLEQFLQESEREDDIQLALEKFKSEVSHLTSNVDQEALDTAIMSRYSLGLHLLEEKTQHMFGGAGDMAEMLTLAANEHEAQGITCGICEKECPPVEPIRGSNCEHIYCENCLTHALDRVSQSKNIGYTQPPLECRHPECCAELGAGESMKTPACIEKAVKFLNDFKELGQDSIGTRWSGGPGKRTSFFQATCGRQDIDYPPVKMPLGAKVKAAASVILSWQKEAPEDKIIVFIECTRTAKALGRVLEALELTFVYYNQMSSAKQKNIALKAFKTDPKCKIFVTSMKCGGQSLNLQMANRAIIVDIWWNKTVEDQAFKRIHRLGQTKETYLVRILARGSIDERISKLQDAKEEIISSALQDDGHKPHFSSDMQLRMLFSTKNVESMIQDLDKEVLGH